MTVKLVKATLINLDTGEETVLSPKEKSRCFFFEWFRYKNYDIQFRLDHNNNLSVDPVLDVDIKDTVTGKSIEKGVWHNNKKKYDPIQKIYMYSFNFEDLHFRLNTALTFQLTLTSDAMIVADKCTPTLVRGENESNP